ncbi:concanavalin A-like lectin/glucanase domain-containing protein [Roridomyces roridus]|uniref:endo-1,4-beta-xylanase n=1 Tax=Roridomyces roridus TaxID=1738132 RepID=A0AAD7B3E4_9AGAR|nr:concanavalin A-like lectin/glucanase domain-containing protein [Roridomyces roridus]
MLLIALLAASTVLAQTQLNISEENWFYYNFWAADETSVTLSYKSDYRQYSWEWGAGAQFWGGKGLETGSTEPLNFTSTYSSTSAGSVDLLLYGITTSPAAEYFIVEAISASTAAQLAAQPILGTITSDDGLYNVYQTTKNATPQYWSVRQTPRDGGVITPATHFASWTALGMSLGTLGMQIVTVRSDAAEEAGAISVTVLNTFDVLLFLPDPPCLMPSQCEPHWAQCGGFGFVRITCCQTGLTCVYENPSFSNCYLPGECPLCGSD